MLTTYERRLMLTYLSNVASRFNHRSPQAEAMDQWLSEHGDVLAARGKSPPSELWG